MSTFNGGGPAYPVTPTDGSGHFWPTELGMSLLDYFAASETISAEDEANNISVFEGLVGPRPVVGWQESPLEWLQWEAKWRARLRYIRAQAMLAERERIMRGGE